MKIYTKTGDKGSTSLTSGERVSKSALRVEAYGTVDELNSFIGLLRSQLTGDLKQEVDALLFETQNELFNLGTHLSTQDTKKMPPLRLNIAYPVKLESEMDRMTAQLPPLKNFVLPGGSKLAAQTHILRTICRRAERFVVRVHESETSGGLDSQVILHLNRLSDYFFVLARYCNLKEGVSEVLWKAP